MNAEQAQRQQRHIRSQQQQRLMLAAMQEFIEQEQNYILAQGFTPSQGDVSYSETVVTERIAGALAALVGIEARDIDEYLCEFSDETGITF